MRRKKRWSGEGQGGGRGGGRAFPFFFLAAGGGGVTVVIVTEPLNATTERENSPANIRHGLDIVTAAVVFVDRIPAIIKVSYVVVVVVVAAAAAVSYAR